MKTSWICALSLLAASAMSNATTAPNNKTENLSQREDIHAFIVEMSEQYDFNQQQLGKVFDSVELQPSIIKAMQRPYEAKPWHRYRHFFLTKKRLNDGVAFWHKYHEDLQRAEATYGVPAEIIVAIIGVETDYGSYLGKYDVINSLSTLAFDYPKRSKFFKKELAQYLLLTRELGVGPHDIKGSYAGAIGEPQFMPSSYRHYAVDFSHTGKRDLIHDAVDAIGSVGNYLAENGWHKGEPIVHKIDVDEATYKSLAKHGYRPYLPVSTLIEKHIVPKSMKKQVAKAAILRFEQPDSADYWLGFNNFYTITRYNTSQNYAMVVYQFAQNLSKHYHNKVS